MKTTHDRIQDLPMKKAKQSRPTREEILEGIGYTPLTFPASLYVPEAVRAAEERANQDSSNRRHGFSRTATVDGTECAVRDSDYNRTGAARCYRRTGVVEPRNTLGLLADRKRGRVDLDAS
jgi:hypothetical protein